MLVVPLIPKKRAMTDVAMRRFCSACIAKRVMKKASVKEKVRRRYDRISMFREEAMAFSDLRRFRLFSGA